MSNAVRESVGAGAGRLQDAIIPVQDDVAIHSLGHYLVATQRGIDRHVQLWGVTCKAIGPPLQHRRVQSQRPRPRDQ